MVAPPSIDRVWRRAVRPSAGAIVAAAIVVWATVGRQLEIPKLGTLWAEDGAVFAHCAYFDPSPLACLAQPYAGYFHLAPRVGALLATLAPAAALSVSIGLAAAGMAALAAFATARAVGEATGSTVAGVLAGASLALVREAGVEVGGNLANLHWILEAAAVVVLLTAWLGRRPRPLEMGIVLVAAASSPFAVVILVIAVAAWLIRREPNRGVIAGLAVVAALQVVTHFVSPRPGPSGRSIPLSAYVHQYVDQVVGRGPFGGLRVPPDWLVAAGMAIVIGLLVRSYMRARARTDVEGSPPPGDSLVAVASVAACLAVGAAMFVVSVDLNRAATPRYAYAPAVLMVEALVLGAALLGRDGRLDRSRSPSRRIGGLALPVVALVLTVGFGRSFFLEARASNGPAFEDGYRAGVAACAAGIDPMSIRISPYPATNDWFVEIPCDRATDPASASAGR